MRMPSAKVMQSIGSKNQTVLLPLIGLQLIIFFFFPRLLKQHFLLPATLTTARHLHSCLLCSPPAAKHLQTSSGRLKAGAFFLPCPEALRGPPCSKGSFQMTLRDLVDLFGLFFFSFPPLLCTDLQTAMILLVTHSNADHDTFSIITDKAP